MKESSRFYSSLALLIVLNLVIKPIWIFGIDRKVQIVAGTETYGNYFALFNFSIVFSFLLDWGLTNFLNQQLAAKQENFIDKAGKLLALKFLFVILYGVVIFTAAFVAGVHHWDILLYVTIIQALTSLFVFLRSIVTAQQWFKTDAWLSVLDKALMILICGSFLYLPSVFGSITIEKFLLTQIFCTSIAVAVVLLIVLTKAISLPKVKPFLPGKDILLVALPFAVLLLLMSVHNRLDAFLIERIHPNGAYQAGIYAGAYRLLDAANMIGYLLASFLLPFIARHGLKEPKMAEIIANARHLLIVSGLMISITFIFLAPWLQEVLYHNQDASAITVLEYCLPLLLCYSLVQVYGTVMTATRKIREFALINLVAVGINVLLNLVLIPVYGAKGSCIAAICSQGFAGLAVMTYVSLVLQINLYLRSWLMYIFIGAGIALFYYFGKNSGINPWLQISVAGLITLILAAVFRLIDWRNWRNLLKGS